ncbi:Cyclic nucleotide-gated potassium channel [compost metagenome]
MSNSNFDRLAKLPALQGFTPEEMVIFFRLATKHEHQPGDMIIRTGDVADCFYIVATGQIEISLKQNGAVTPLAQLSQGSLVGEMPLLYSQPVRQADVVATQSTTLLRFNYADYEKLSTQNPQLAKKFRGNLGRIVAGRVWSTLPTEQSPSKSMEPVSQGTGPLEGGTAQKAVPAAPTNRETMQKAPIFAGLNEEELRALEAIALPMAYESGKPIVRTGDPASAFYLITTGYAEVQTEQAGKSTPLARLGPGQVFGEMALVYKQPNRTADVVAVSDLKLLCFPFDDYQRLAAGVENIARRMRANLGRVAASRSWSMPGVDETRR